jgi:glutathionylspermidine synthase
MDDSATSELDLDPHVERWNAMREVAPQSFADVRCRMILEGCKWDPQVGDVSTLSPFPLIIPAGVAQTLGQMAERLTAEARGAEQALLNRPECLRVLGLPRPVQRALGGQEEPTPAPARVIRYDFHPTTEGWRISEANADVPGGYTEASLFPRLMSEHCRGAWPGGDPAAALADAVIASIGEPGRVGLLAAAGHMEDHQVVAFLAGVLRDRGCTTEQTHPCQLTWAGGTAVLHEPEGTIHRFDALVRFYQGEWLARWPVGQGWPNFFRGGRTPVCNPGTALLLESKRFPLLWDRLGLELPTWRKLLPPTRDPMRVAWRPRPGWVLKTALCNTGDTVALGDDAGRRAWSRAARVARWQPGFWVAQRRFESLAIPTPCGPLYPCLGVYTVNGRAAGIYGRMAPRRLIDYAALEVAVLVEHDPVG